jgi:predicted lipid-binding transport protein (Tim44 family)
VYLDIVIFAAVAAFLIYRLNAVLGTRNEDERKHPNPFSGGKKSAPALAKPAAAPKPSTPPADFGKLIDAASNKDGRIETGLDEITEADPQFDAAEFMEGARHAFEMVVTAFSRGDRAALKPLLSPKLYAGFDADIRAREDAGHTSETTLHRIKDAKIVEAHLGGAMVYITVDYDIEQTTVTRDKSGAVVEGDPDRISNVEDIWTFTRDIRSPDPNWVLIETRAAEK